MLLSSVHKAIGPGNKRIITHEPSTLTSVEELVEVDPDTNSSQRKHDFKPGWSPGVWWSGCWTRNEWKGFFS